MSLQIIGTSHIARESMQKIKDHIISEKPDIVAVELDASRLQAIFEPARKIKISDIKKVGFMGWAFAAIGSWLQRKLGKKVGLAPGADMRAAIRTANQIGAKIALIDRPIAETLHRLSTQMTAWQKLKFFSSLLWGVLAPEKKVEFDLEKVPEEKIVRMLTKELGHKFPVIFRVLVKERDKYLAERIRELVSANPGAKILAVLGAGHLRGVRKALKLGNL